MVTMIFSFYPTDITYDVVDGKPRVLLFGRTLNNEQVCVIDSSFRPYFYAIGDKEGLQVLEQDEFRVTEVQEVTKNLNEKEVKALKVFVNVPKAVPVLRKLAQELGFKVFEYDILFTRRYLLDKRITPFVLTKVEGEEVQLDFKVRCIKVNKIECVKGTFADPGILAFDIETYNPDGKKINPEKYPIIMIAVHTNNFSRILTWKKFNSTNPEIEFLKDEKSMLKRFFEIVGKLKPDIITGYFSDGFDFPYIIKRAKIKKIKMNLGLDFSEPFIRGRIQSEVKITGIVHFDVFKFVRRVISRSLETYVYSLDAVAEELLGEKKIQVDLNKLAYAWNKNIDKELEEFCRYNLHDAKLTFNLASKLLPNLIELVKIINLPMFDINRMSFSQLVEWFLIKKASEFNEIVPNKPSRTQEALRMDDPIKGAFVFEPTPGLYKDIVVFDYRSLYPSIIASHNISRGTINCDCCKDAEKIKTSRGEFHFCRKKKGLFSMAITELILKRAEIKKELRVKQDPLLKARSQSLKLLANSFYGYIGFAPARWYCKECAESVTAWARHYIHKAIDFAEENFFKVIYSDTDSIFLLLDGKTKQDALNVVNEINKKLPGLMELEFEDFYPAGIFVQAKASETGAKKKYALINEKNQLKVRGFEAVRRNWSPIAKDVQKEVLRIILEEQNPVKAKKYVRQIVSDLRSNNVPKEKVIIHTQLSKSIDSYESIGPHVAAAMRLRERGETISPGMIIKYIVIKGEKGLIRNRVRLVEETKQEDYDGEYYITNQVLPGIDRIFAVLGISTDDLVSSSTQSKLSGFK